MKILKDKIMKIDGRGYKEYKGIRGRYRYNDFLLEILYVQGDPFASPSLVAVEIDLDKYGYEKTLYKSNSQKTAFEDYIGRKIYKSVRDKSKGRRGTGKSGDISIYKNSEKIMKRSSVEIKNNILIVKFYLGLPARGRRVLSKEAVSMFFNEIPEIFKVLKIENIEIEKLKEHIKINEDADYIREEIRKRDIIAFVANGSILPRQSGVNRRPLNGAVVFKSPEELEVELSLKDGKKIKGMALKRGINIITGGGFHGKSTLLNAIEEGIYNHIPGDGREYVISDLDCVKIRAEDGRSISNLDISPFINNLPLKKDTEKFFTENASGSTSQAAGIMEALEMGAKVLLIDEDTSATNFMMRDAKIQKIIKKEKEPITPFIERIRAMHEKMGISSIIVVGGLGDYFDVADKIIALDSYNVYDISEKAKKISEDLNRYIRNSELNMEEFEIKKRYISTVKAKKLFDRKEKVKSRGQDDILIGKETIDIRNVEQLAEDGQTNLIAEIIKYIIKNSKDRVELRERLDEIDQELKDKNISTVLKLNSANLSLTRKYEIASAINRIREEIFID